MKTKPIKPSSKSLWRPNTTMYNVKKCEYCGYWFRLEKRGSTASNRHPVPSRRFCDTPCGRRYSSWVTKRSQQPPFQVKMDELVKETLEAPEEYHFGEKTFDNMWDLQVHIEKKEREATLRKVEYCFKRKTIDIKEELKKNTVAINYTYLDTKKFEKLKGKKS